jgi:hypothetical protein
VLQVVAQPPHVVDAARRAVHAQPSPVQQVDHLAVDHRRRVQQL